MPKVKPLERLASPLEVGINAVRTGIREFTGSIAPQDYNTALAEANARAKLAVTANSQRREQRQVDKYLNTVGEFITEACGRVATEGVEGGKCLSAQAWLLPVVQTMAGVGTLGEAYMKATEGLDRSKFRGEKMREAVIKSLPQLVVLEKELIAMIKSNQTWENLDPKQIVDVALNIAVILRAISAYKGDMVPSHQALDGVNVMEQRLPGAGVAFFMVLVGGLLPEAECGVVGTLALMDTKLAAQASRRQHKRNDLVAIETQRGGIQAKPHSWGDQVEKSICMGTGGPAFFVEDLENFVQAARAKKISDKKAAEEKAKQNGQTTGAAEGVTPSETSGPEITREILQSILFAANKCFGDKDPRAQALLVAELGRHLKDVKGGPDLLKSVLEGDYRGKKITTEQAFLVAMAVEDGPTHTAMMDRIVPAIQGGDRRLLVSYASAYLEVAPYLVPLQAEKAPGYSQNYRQRMLDLALELAKYDLAEAYQGVVATDMPAEQVLLKALEASFVLQNRHSRVAELLGLASSDLAVFPNRGDLATAFAGSLRTEIITKLKEMLITKAPVFDGINSETLGALAEAQMRVVAPGVGDFLHVVVDGIDTRAATLMETQIETLRGQVANLEKETSGEITGGLVAQYKALGELQGILSKALLKLDISGQQQGVRAVQEAFNRSLTELAGSLGLGQLVPKLLEGNFDSSSARATFGALGSGGMEMETKGQTAELLAEAVKLLKPLLEGAGDMVGSMSGVAQARMDGIKAYEDVIRRLNGQMVRLQTAMGQKITDFIATSADNRAKAKAKAMNDLLRQLEKLEVAYYDSLLTQSRVVAGMYETEFKTRQKVADMATVDTRARADYIDYWTEILEDVKTIPGWETGLRTGVARAFSLTGSLSLPVTENKVDLVKQIRALANTMLGLINPAQPVEPRQ